MQQEKTFDFIVVGSGISGLNSALTLSEFGKVLIVTKKKLSDSSTNLAQGGIAAVMKRDDSLASHHDDTLAAGYNHNDKKAVDLLVKNGQKAIKQLEKLGVQFDRQKNGDFVSSYEAAHSYPRILHASDFTGQEIEKTLIAAVLKKKTIEIWEDTAAVDLIIKNKQCYGLQVLKKQTFINLYSRAVILATGGVGQLYQWTTNPTVATGDGIALAYRAGAKMKDLEFVQFHPTALAENASPLLLLSEALRGEGAVLLNDKHERFMQKYHPKAELAPRDIVSRAILHEQQNRKVFLDISHKGKNFILKRFPNITRELKLRGFDLTRQPIPVTPAAHFLCGGIATDIYGRTSIKNLFAYGEVAATGVHGANRLASNSLLEGIVFSNQIKHCINELPQKPYVIAKPQKNLVPSPQSLISNDEVKKQLREIMWQYVGIIRTPVGLAIAQNELEKMQNNQLDNQTKNMLTVALLITKAAQQRKKSLGTHYINKSKTNLLQYKKPMQQITLKITLVIFTIESNALCVYVPNGKLPFEIISDSTTLDEQVEKIFSNNLTFPLEKNYIEQLYTFSKEKNEITLAYFVLLEKNDMQTTNEQNWKKAASKNFAEHEIISYALQRLRWKIEYTNVVYSLLPKTFTLSELQKTYEIILGKKLDKRNFRKKILSLKFLKPTGEKRVINARPAQMYTFSKRSPQLVKVFS
jgi:L-aspartate oxidase